MINFSFETRYCRRKCKQNNFVPFYVTWLCYILLLRQCNIRSRSSGWLAQFHRNYSKSTLEYCEYWDTLRMLSSMETKSYSLVCSIAHSVIEICKDTAWHCILANQKKLPYLYPLYYVNEIKDWQKLQPFREIQIIHYAGFITKGLER